MIEDREGKYDGIITYKIGEVAKRADVNKKQSATMKKGNLSPNLIAATRAIISLPSDILTGLNLSIVPSS
jgi:hypothetical protein